MAQLIVCGLAEDKGDLASLFQLLIVGNKISQNATFLLPCKLELLGLALIYS